MALRKCLFTLILRVHAWTGDLGGPGNFAANPLFMDFDGPADLAATEDDRLLLSPRSARVDAGETRNREHIIVAYPEHTCYYAISLRT